MRRPIALLVAAGVIAASVMLAGSCANEPGRALSGAEIRGLFSGNTVTGQHHKKGYSFESYYEPAGSFRSYQGGARTPTPGRWWISGNQICIRWEHEQRNLCRTVRTDDNGRYWKVLVKRNGQRVNIVTFHSFNAGNPKNL